ncbi:hypothetical protein ACIBK9_22925 [Nonomuraea sp. NPDC050227]|uniref:hypothetical protein n=1 Tax=unclassified Nonomuraea TaxID=2593643 RepID=UPI0037AC33A0
MLPVHSDTPFLPWQDPREATRLLRYALRRDGFSHKHQSKEKAMSVLSVSTEPTVWCIDGSFVWNEEGGAPVTHPIDDPVGAARRSTVRHRRHVPSHTPTDSVRELAA